jgi:hypothetical protein
LENLPPDSSFVTALRGGIEWTGWNRNSELLASVIDAIQILSWYFVTVNSKKAPKKPDPYPRPGEEKRKEAEDKLPNPLMTALRGEPLERREIGPGAVIPAPKN